MLNKKDIYSHLKNGGAVEDLLKALENEINAANERIELEKQEEAKKAETDKQLKEAKAHAVAALKGYLNLANKDYTDKDIETLVSLLGDARVDVKLMGQSVFRPFVFDLLNELY